MSEEEKTPLIDFVVSGPARLIRADDAQSAIDIYAKRIFTNDLLCARRSDTAVFSRQPDIHKLFEVEIKPKLRK